MPKGIADITMSLDGHVTGPGADVQHDLEDGTPLLMPGTRQRNRQREVRPPKSVVHLADERT